MDPELWGNLQCHVDLESMVYAKLPFRHFFQLRVVCKEWNRLASDAAFLNYIYKDFLLLEPYFVLNAHGPDGKVCGLLARDPRTQQWTWTRLPNGSAGSGFIFNELWSTAGLVLSNSLDSNGSRFVFNLHTRHILLLPPPPVQTRSPYPYIGMEVDTGARPYQFKIVQGNDDVSTLSYDSRTNTWSAKASHGYVMLPLQSIAAHAQGMYLARHDGAGVIIYDTARDVWANFDPPQDGSYDDFVRGCGAWRDRIFLPSMDGIVHRIWRLTNFTEHDWMEVATMPLELCSWLLYENNEPPVNPLWIQILASYCSQSILIYAWWNDFGAPFEGGERFVILDLETMEFRKLELPFGPLNQSFLSHGDLYAVC